MNKIKSGFKLFIAIIIVLGGFNSVTAMEEEEKEYKAYKVISKELWQQILKDDALRERLLYEKIRELKQCRKNQCTDSANATPLGGFLSTIGCPLWKEDMIVASYFKHHCNTRVPHIYRNISVLACAMSIPELIVSEVLILAGAKVNDRECEATPLCRAVGSQEYTREKVVLLLNVGADPNLLTRARKETALHVAVREKKVEIVELLLERGADPNIADKYGETPLDLAIDRNYQKIVELLQHWNK